MVSPVSEEGNAEFEWLVYWLPIWLTTTTA